MYKKIFSKIFFFVFLFAFFLNFLTPEKTFAGCISSPEALAVPFCSDIITENGTQQDLEKKINEKHEFCKAKGKIYNGDLSNSGDGCVDGTPTGCNPLNGFNVANCLSYLLGLIFAKILQGINWVLNQLLWLVSFILDFVVYTTVVKFKSNFSDLNGNIELGGIGTVGVGGILGVSNSAVGGNGLIYYLWGMLRDFLNIIILILVIYYAVYAMFEGFGDNIKSFITLLVFSIVVNFSLLAVRFAIDISNILTLQAYTLAVQPRGTATFEEFRSKNGNSPSSIGEFILNSVDYSQLIVKTAGNAQAKMFIEDISSTFMFQLGRFFILLGVIYLLFMITGILVSRVVAFVYAMLLASFIAAEYFLESMDTGKNSSWNKLKDGIQTLTKPIQGEFITALVKGPILMFYVFLVGVLANAIFSQGIIQELANSSRGTALSGTDSLFTQNIYVFFKFAFFAALCKLAFDKLNDLNFGGGSNSGWVMGTANKIANFGMRNTVGRSVGLASGLARGTVGRGLNRIGESDWAQRAKLRLDQAGESRTAKFLGLSNALKGTGTRLTNLGTQSFDPRLSGRVKTLAGKISGATGLKMDFGNNKGEKGTGGIRKYKEEVEKQKETYTKAKDASSRYAGSKQDEGDIKLEKDSLSEKELKQWQAVKIDLNGKKYTPDEIDAAFAAFQKNGGKGGINIGSDPLDEAGAKRLFERKDGKPGEGEKAKWKADEERNKYKKKLVGDRMKAAEKERLEHLALNDTTDVGDKARAEILKNDKEGSDKIKKISEFVKKEYANSVGNILSEAEKSQRAGKGTLSDADKNLLWMFYNNTSLFSENKSVGESKIKDHTNAEIDVEKLRSDYFPDLDLNDLKSMKGLELFGKVIDKFQKSKENFYKIQDEDARRRGSVGESSAAIKKSAKISTVKDKYKKLTEGTTAQPSEKPKEEKK